MTYSERPSPFPATFPLPIRVFCSVLCRAHFALQLVTHPSRLTLHWRAHQIFPHRFRSLNFRLLLCKFIPTTSDNIFPVASKTNNLHSHLPPPHQLAINCPETTSAATAAPRHPWEKNIPTEWQPEASSQQR